MKIYTKYPSGITKIIKEKEFYQTEDLSNTITVYVDRTNLTDITYTLTLEFLRADGRKTTLIEVPPVAGEDTTLIEDDITYDIHNFVLTETQLAVAGALAFTCYITIVDNNVTTSRGALFNAINNVRKTVAYPGNTIFVVDDENDVPVIVADMKNAIDILNGQLAGKVNTADIVDDLTHTDSDKVLSANQGKVLNDAKADRNNSSQTIVAGTVEVNTLKANTKVISPRIQSNTNDNFYEQIGMYQGSDNSLYKRFIVQRKNSAWLPDVSQPVYFPFFQLSDDTYHNDGKDNVTGLGLGLRTTNGVKPDFQIIPAFRFSSDWQNFAHDKLEPVYLFRPNLALLPNGQIVTVDNPGVYITLDKDGYVEIEAYNEETGHEAFFIIGNNSISFSSGSTTFNVNEETETNEPQITGSLSTGEQFVLNDSKFTLTNAHFYEGNKQVATQEYVNSEMTTLDNDLQAQIDGINAGQNLADIVADLTALNNLPTSNLEVNDKVQVLVDSNHDNASTVYNWTGSVWSYIGKYGQDSYSKAEVNALLNAKQGVIDASHKLNADLVDDTNATNKFVTASEKAQITTNANNISNLRTGSDLTNTLEFTKTVNQSWDYIIQNGLSSTPLISQADFNKLNQNTVIIYNVISSVDNVQFTFYLRCESAIVDQSDVTLNYKGTYGLETGDGMFTMEFSANNSLHCDMHLTYTQTYTREDVDAEINNSFLTDAQMTVLLSEVFD